MDTVFEFKNPNVVQSFKRKKEFPSSPKSAPQPNYSVLTPFSSSHHPDEYRAAQQQSNQDDLLLPSDDISVIHQSRSVVRPAPTQLRLKINDEKGGDEERNDEERNDERTAVLPECVSKPNMWKRVRLSPVEDESVKKRGCHPQNLEESKITQSNSRNQLMDDFIGGLGFEF